MPHTLRRIINAKQYFTLVFGGVVGVAWMIILGNLVAQAGPIGTVLALIAGMICIMPVALCYAEIAALIPTAGGEIVYAHEIFGTTASFLAGWTLILLYLSTCVFEAISLGWLFNLLIPGIRGPVLYEMFGQEIYLGGLIIGIAATLILSVINIMGAHATARLQELLTYFRLAMMALIVAVGMFWGHSENLQPLFRPVEDRSTWIGIFGVLITVPFWYAGFSVFASAMEEKASATSLRQVVGAVLGAIVAAATFYCLLVIAISSLMPWQEMAALELPTATVFQVALQSETMMRIVLVTAILGNITAWNALFLACSRVLFALGRSHIIMPRFSHIHPRHRTPAFAIVCITIITVVGSFLGQGFIMPIVNVSAIGFSLIYAMTCMAVIRVRKSRPDQARPFAIPGGMTMAWFGMAASLLIMSIAIVQPFLAQKVAGVPTEWIVALAWTALGIIFWYGSRSIRQLLSETERRALLLGDEY